jgi:hypothetical protein
MVSPPEFAHALPDAELSLRVRDSRCVANEAGMDGFARTTPTYLSRAGAALVPLRAIEPPYRTPTQPQDWRGFDRTRLISALKGIVVGAQIEPVLLVELPSGHFPPAHHRYRVCHRYHRFYASIAAGFHYLPGVIS